MGMCQRQLSTCPLRIPCTIMLSHHQPHPYQHHKVDSEGMGPSLWQLSTDPLRMHCTSMWSHHQPRPSQPHRWGGCWRRCLLRSCQTCRWCSSPRCPSRAPGRRRRRQISWPSLAPSADDGGRDFSTRSLSLFPLSLELYLSFLSL